MLGIERDNTLAGGAGSGVDPDAVLQIRTQQAVGIRVAQVGLAEERQLSDVIHTADIVRGDALFFHLFPVVGDIVPYMFHLADDLFILDFQDFLPRCRFDFRLVVPAHTESSFMN